MDKQTEQDSLAVYSEEFRARGLYIVSAKYDPATTFIHVHLKSGVVISFLKTRSQALAKATNDELSEIEISPAGWSIDFPRIDDGVSLSGILAFRFGNKRWEEAWAAKDFQAVAA